jgi:hypothetical protein
MEIAAGGLGRRPRETLQVYWGAVGAVLFGAGVVASGAWLPFDIEPLGVDPFTAPGLVFFLAVVEVVPEASGAGPTVALALAAEPTLAEGSTVWSGAVGVVGAAGAVGVAAGGVGF